MTILRPELIDSEIAYQFETLCGRIKDEQRASRVELLVNLHADQAPNDRSVQGVDETARVSPDALNIVEIGHSDPSHKMVEQRLTAFAVGTVGLLRVWVSNVREKDPELYSAMTSWCVEAFVSDPVLALEVLHRLGRSTPVLHRLRVGLKADAAILWHMSKKKKTLTLKVQTSSGISDIKDVDILLGQGVVGRQTVDSAPSMNSLLDLSTVANPGLVQRYGWKWCYTSPLIDDSQRVGALAFYYKSDDRPTVEPNLLHSEFAAQRFILTADVVRRVSREAQVHENHRLAQTVNKLQVGLTVLGLAHDLKNRTEHLEIVAKAVAAALPKTEDGRDALLRALNRLEISTASPEVFRTAIDSVTSDSQYISDIVSAMNKVSEAKSSQRRRLTLADEVQTCSPMLAALAADRKAAISYHLDGHIQVRCSETDMARILLNSVANSLAWSARSIMVRVARVSDLSDTKDTIRPNLRSYNANHACIAIVDDGQGMSPSLLAVCRQPFESRRSGGTGLGLFVVEHIAKTMNGTLVIESVEGRGTGVFVIVPTVR